MDCVCGVLVQSHSFHIWQHSSDVAIENCLKNITYLRLLHTMQDFLHPFPQHVRFPDCLQGPMPSRWMRRSWTNGSSIHAWCALHADTCKAEASNWFRKLGKFMWCKLHPGDAIHTKTQSNRKKKHKNLERHWSQALLTSSSIVPKMLVVVISMLQCNLELRVHKGAMECHECDIWTAKVPWATTNDSQQHPLELHGTTLRPCEASNWEAAWRHGWYHPRPQVQSRGLWSVHGCRPYRCSSQQTRVNERDRG